MEVLFMAYFRNAIPASTENIHEKLVRTSSLWAKIQTTELHNIKCNHSTV